jgi:SAM-dependent MidA family methyltransferase
VSEVLSLEDEIRRLIAVAGPMPVSEFFDLCLTHPVHGYYTTRDPFGAAGDFTTAPEISQMFGELIGLWTVSVWRQMGSPANLRLVELGPGRGTMMLDMLRAAQVVPGFRAAIVVHMIEVSPTLERLQRQTLGKVDVPLFWHRSLEDVPAGPVIVVANEFFDALPIQQAVKRETGWHERRVGIDAEGKLAFVLAPTPLPRFAGTLPPKVRVAPIDSVYEWRSDRVAFALGHRLVREGGAALVVDYGHAESGDGDTLQAVSEHRYVDPLDAPGEADLTAHVDFQALVLAAEGMGAVAQGPVPQGTFLSRLGIEARAQALKARADEKQIPNIDSALHRLIDTEADAMGALFKVLALAHPSLGILPGFEAEDLTP